MIQLFDHCGCFGLSFNCGVFRHYPILKKKVLDLLIQLLDLDMWVFQAFQQCFEPLSHLKPNWTIWYIVDVISLDIQTFSICLAISVLA